MAPQPAGGPVSLDKVGPATVLYIEDTPENLALVRRLLARYPNTAYLEAESAELGLDIARREKPDIILMDMNLPGMSGGEALKVLRADPAIAEIVVIGLTGAALPAEATAADAGGFNGYIAKPYRVAQLLAVLAEKLSRRPQTDPPKTAA
jgi:CheY-like chemotaxis protein